MGQRGGAADFEISSGWYPMNMQIEPEAVLFLGGAVLTVLVTIAVGVLVRRAFREERLREEKERR